MLYVFCGGDVIEVRRRALLKLAELESVGARVWRLESETYESGALPHFLGSVSLFGASEAALVDNPSHCEDMQKEVAENMSALAASPHTFVLVDGTPSATYRKTLKAHAREYVELAAPARREHNPFALADAFAARDRKLLWLFFHAARRAGARAEEISATLWWQLKVMRLAARTHSATEAGVKEFIYNKAKRALKNYSRDELETLAHELLTLHHDARAGKADLDLALERWLLRV
jgi:DNA polymerase III delta subunit